MRQVTWWRLAGRRLRCLTFFLSQFLLAVVIPISLETPNLKAGGNEEFKVGFERTVLPPLLFPPCQLYCWERYSFGQWSTVLAVYLSNAFATLRLLTGVERKLWHCASTAQQQTKHWCGINAILGTNPKHITIWAAEENISPISARQHPICSEVQCNFLY